MVERLHMAAVPLTPVVLAVAKRPRIWGEALRASAAMARRNWWRTPPFLPVPDREYVSWRIATAYGSSDTTPSPDDLVAYLEWRRRQRRSSG